MRHAALAVVDRREFRAAISSAFRCGCRDKPDQHEGAERQYRDGAGHHHGDVVAVGVFEPIAHLWPPGRNSILGPPSLKASADQIELSGVALAKPGPAPRLLR